MSGANNEVNLHLVKQVKELTKEYEVNEHLKNGWFLLCVGFRTDVDGYSTTVYSIGTYQEQVQKNDELSF
jgi:hypothetical protein